MKRNKSININHTKITFFAFIIAFSTLCYSQHPNQTYRVFLKDKGLEKFEKGSPLYDSTIKIYSKRAIDRRLKVKKESELWTYEDAPLFEYYINIVESLGAKTLLKLRWDNYIVVTCDSIIKSGIESLPFVKYVQSTSGKLKYQTHHISARKEDDLLKEILNEDFLNCDYFDYGDSYIQNQIINSIDLHNLGITGFDVIIGLIDTGFNIKVHRAFRKTKILAEKDFIFGDSLVSNEDSDTSDQEGHGTICLSTICSYDPGHLIGIAPSASFLLAKTEFLPTETHLEEDNYAAAIEWLEASGADIISSSLGYFFLDSTQESYSYSELDGNTTIVSRAINRAVSRGVVCVTAAGNTGPKDKTLNSPADADSVLAIAAVTESKDIPDFTSRGPRGDGKLKPDIASMGVQVICAPAQWQEGTIKVNGTSMATPQIAGAIALILSIFPELTPYQIRKSLLETASRCKIPDNRIGYGIPNAFRAAQNNGIIISPCITYKNRQFQRVAFYIITSSLTPDAWLYLKFHNNYNFERFKLYKSSNNNLYTADIPISLFEDSSAIGYIIVNDWTMAEKYNTRRFPYYENNYFTIKHNSVNIPCGVNINNLPITDELKTNAYFFPSVATNINNQIVINIPLNQESNIFFQIYNNLGQKVYSYHELNRSPGVANIPINIQGYASGAYFAIVDYNNITEFLNFIITR